MSAVVHSALHPRLEFLPSREMRALQGRKLRALVQRATATEGMYARSFLEAGLDPDAVHGLDDLERIPFVTKQQMIDDQEASPPFGTRLSVPEGQIARLAMSGGSSGGGREIVGHTRQDLLVLGGVQGTPFRWGGLGEDDVIVFHVPLANSTSSLAFPYGVEAVGRIKYLIAHEGFAERLTLMRTHGATGMWGTPSTLNGFTNECERLGVVPRELFPDFKAIIIAAENFPVAWAERIADLWDASLIEGYGATQTHGGYCLSSCEVGAFPGGRRGTMHAYEWSFVLEVRDPDSGLSTLPGAEGELIVTTLDKRASPALRYRTGDRVTVVEGPCPCGRETLLIESGTVGRYDDMLKVKGINLWPDRVDDVVFAVPGVREYQASVVISEKGRDEVELRFAVRGSEDEAAVGSEIARAFKREFGLTPRPIASPFEELAIRYGDGGKARRWSDRRSEMLR